MAYLSSEMSDHLTEENIERLNKANVWTTNDLFSMDLMDIKRASNIKYSVLKGVYETVKQRYTLPCHELNFVLDKSIRECKMCPTGLPELTQALDGGFQTQEIVEFYGETECGKTEMCYLLCGEILTHFENWNILYVAANFDIDHEKVIKYIKAKSGGREFTEDDIFKCLSRVEVAKPTKLTDLSHLLNTLVHTDKKNAVKCLIIDSLSFLVQEDVLDIKTCNLDDPDEIERFSHLKSIARINREKDATKENTKRDLIDIYLYEVMRLITTVALTKNVIVVLTNSDPQLASSKSWTNAIDHRIQLAKLSQYSSYCTRNPRSSVCRATILKTIHNTSRVGYTIPFAINNDGLFRLTVMSNTSPESPDD